LNQLGRRREEELAIFNQNYMNFILNPPEVITKGRKPESRLRSASKKIILSLNLIQALLKYLT